MRKSKPRETTIRKMLLILQELAGVIDNPEFKMSYFCHEKGVSGSFAKSLVGKGIIVEIDGEGGHKHYKWTAQTNVSRDMATIVVLDLNRRSKDATAKRNALKFADELHVKDEAKRQQEIVEATRKVVNEEANVKEIVHKQTHILPQPDQPIYTVTKEEPDVLTITTVTYYFFKWLKIKRVVIHTKGK